MAKGFSQREGVDYFETFAPVVRYESIRILLAIAAKDDLEIAKFDVKTAFLYGELQEEIYMQQPEGYIKGNGRQLVCELLRSLYGLKQSPRCWNEKFVKFLESFNLKATDSDKCVFVGSVDECLVYVALYVDDCLVLCNSQSVIERVLRYLGTHFQVTSGVADEFLGFRIKRDRSKRTIKIDQAGYISRLVEKFIGESAKSVGVLPSRGRI